MSEPSPDQLKMGAAALEAALRGLTTPRLAKARALRIAARALLLSLVEYYSGYELLPEEIRAKLAVLYTGFGKTKKPWRRPDREMRDFKLSEL